MRSELERLGISVPRVEDRRVLFDATAQDIARCNIRLRAADRILIQVGEFPAADFDALYEGIRSLRWRELLGPSPAVSVDARSVKSKLTALPSVQSVAKKAIMDALAGAKRRTRADREAQNPRSTSMRNPRSTTIRNLRSAAAQRNRTPRTVREPSPAWMTETGPRYDVQVSLQQDRAAVSLDTTGPGLHKRGYRRHVGEAPLRENLAAALVLLSRWDASRPFADPVCGSGTIAIEAALQAANISPGIGRRFSAEDWPLFPESIWREERASARDAQARDVRVSILASDQDPGMVRAASANASAAGVADLIQFRTAPLESFTSDQEFGCLVCNPPYGERLGNTGDADDLARSMGSLWRTLPTWSFFVLSALENFERSFGTRAARNRKLYNGNIRCWYYQYFGPLPRGRAGEAPRDGEAGS